MKKFIIFFLLTVNLFALQFFTNYYKALQYAKYYNRPIFLMIVSSNCSHCIRFARALAKKQDIQNYINKNYIVLLIDTTITNFIPPNIDYNGYVPYFVLLLPNGYPYTPSIKGEIDINTLFEYLYNGKLLFQKVEELAIKPEDVLRLKKREFYYFGFEGEYRGKTARVEPTEILIRLPDTRSSGEIK